MLNVVSNRIGAAAIGLVACGMLGTEVSAHNCIGEMHYTAEGKLQVELGSNFSNKTGVSLEPIRDVEVRLRRDNRPSSLTITHKSTVVRIRR